MDWNVVVATAFTLFIVTGVTGLLVVYRSTHLLFTASVVSGILALFTYLFTR